MRARRPLRRLEAEELKSFAVRALARCSHSTRELREKLEKRAARPAEVEPLLEQFTARGWLDDRRFARDYARLRAVRRYGRYRIARELRRKGIAEEWIEEALKEVFPAEKDERALVRQRIRKRVARERPPYGLKLLRSLYASLLRAGFSSAIIRDELFTRARGKFPDDSGLEIEEDEQA